MNSKFLLLSFVLIAVLFSGCAETNNSEENSASPIIIKKSVGQGDEDYDMSMPAEVCGSLLEEFHDSSPALDCHIIVEKRVDYVDVDYADELKKECPSGYSIAGCYSCVFECKNFECPKEGVIECGGITENESEAKQCDRYTNWASKNCEIKGIYE